jgi:hypothetical protein
MSIRDLKKKKSLERVLVERKILVREKFNFRKELKVLFSLRWWELSKQRIPSFSY